MANTSPAKHVRAGIEMNARALELEMQSIGMKGRKRLPAAFAIHQDEWKLGNRDRELALHLGFIAWYLNVEPPFLTGLDQTTLSTRELTTALLDAHDWLLPAGLASSDFEALYVFGLMGHLYAWACGDEQTWIARAEVYRARYLALAPAGIVPSVFEGRGAYGDYFAHHARLRDRETY